MSLDYVTYNKMMETNRRWWRIRYLEECLNLCVPLSGTFGKTKEEIIKSIRTMCGW